MLEILEGSAVWAGRNDDITCTVRVGDGPWMPYTAAAGNVEESCRDMHARLLNGEAGPIAPFVAPAVTGEMINIERARRIVAGAVFDGIYVTGSDKDISNLNSLAFGAQLRVLSGDTTTITSFRDGNDVEHPLTPPELIGLWQQSATLVSAIYAASWALKAMTPIPADYANDAHWPASA